MRPTLPIGPWRLAVDLRATAAIQNNPGTPAFGCRCTWCDHWSRSWRRVLPDELAGQLQRSRIDVSRPSDLYAFAEVPEGAQCRVLFHVVGNVLSGPVVWREDAGLGTMLVYSTLREPPRNIGLAIVARQDAYEGGMGMELASTASLLQVDFRLFVPAVAPAGADGHAAGRGADP